MIAMETMYKKKRAQNHKIVEKERIGNSIYMTILSISGERYTVSFSINYTCDCKYASLQGIPNNKLCSHALAALREWIK